MSTLQIENLWQYIQTLSLSAHNKQWLADRLMESVYHAQKEEETSSETEYILASDAMKEIIAQGDQQIASGKYRTTKVQDLWK